MAACGKFPPESNLPVSQIMIAENEFSEEAPGDPPLGIGLFNRLMTPKALDRAIQLMRCGFLLVFAAAAGNANGAKPVISSEVQEDIRARVDYGYNPGIIVGVVNENGRAYFSYGQTSLETGSVPDEHTVYEIGSVTKTFTGTLLAEMAARGEVSFGEPVKSLLPDGNEVPERNGIQISLQQLATHASGLPANPTFNEQVDPVNPFANFAEEDLYEFLKSYRLPRRPGAEFEYSNLGVGLLGHALALRLGFSYEEALRNRILNPLGLEDTTITPSAEQELRRATGYTGVVLRPPLAMKVLVGAGGLVSTASDMLRFLEYQLGIRETELSPVLLETQRSRFSAGSSGLSLGLCWFVISSGSIQIVFHDGATTGHTAFVGFNRRTGTGVVVLTNSRVNNQSNVQDIGLNVLEPSFPLNRVLRPVELSLETKRAYVGTYENDDGASFEIGLLHNHLTLAHSEDRGMVFTLYPQSSRRFLLHEAGLEAAGVFNSDASGEVVSLVWTQSGQSAKFLKKSIPLHLTAQFDSGVLQLILKGNTRIDYVIEASGDLREWSPISTNTIWDSPIVDASGFSTSRRFYRAHVLE